MAEANVEKRTSTWQWNHSMTEHLIARLQEYKNEMDYQNIDFNKDVITLYSQLRERMAERFPGSFGPVELTAPTKDLTEMSQQELKEHNQKIEVEKFMIRKGYNRIKEKIRAIRKADNKAMTTGTRSGSGKVVQEFYEELSEIWKGSPATEMLSCGIKSSEKQGNMGSERPISPTSSSVTDSSLCDSDHEDSTCEDQDNDMDENQETKRGTKRSLSSIRRIVDDKRKHLEKPLSAAKRDEVLMRSAREDLQLKKKTMEQLQESQASFQQLAKCTTSSLLTIGRGISEGMGLLAVALNPNVMQYQNSMRNPHQSQFVTYHSPQAQYHSSSTSQFQSNSTGFGQYPNTQNNFNSYSPMPSSLQPFDNHSIEENDQPSNFESYEN